MKSYTTKVGQSLFDIAIEVYGHVQGVFWLMEDNPGVGLTHRLIVGQTLLIRDAMLDKRQANFLADFAPFQTIDEPDRPVGIGYWHVEEYKIP